MRLVKWMGIAGLVLALFAKEGAHAQGYPA